MIEAVLPAALGLLAELAPSFGSSALIKKGIDLLVVAIPAVIQTAKDLYPVVKTAIDALRGNPVSTPEQLAELDALEARLDAEYDAASAAAKAEDDAADAAGKA